MTDTRLLVKVSQWYYDQGLTQDAIAKKLGTSRSTISRMLSQAKRLGIIKFQIATETVVSFDVDLERQLETTFSLDEAVVFDAGTSDPAPYLTRTAGQVLLRSLFAGATVGISWGRTVRAVVDQLPVPDVAIDDVTVVALCGGIGSTRPDIMSNTVVLELASKLKAKAAVLNAPVVVQNRAVLNTLKHEPSIEPVLRLAKSCHIALVGIGAVGQFSTLTTLKHLTAAELRDITRTGAVGDVCSRFYTADGVAIDSDLNRRTMGIDLADLKKIPRVIAVAWGSEKTQAVLGALRMGIVNVLVTDRVVAEGILHHLQSV